MVATRRRRPCACAAAALAAIAAVGTLALVIGPQVARRLGVEPLLARAPLSHAFVARDGELLQLTLAADGRYRLRADLDAVDPLVVEATLIKEDRWFGVHPGFNPVALVSATFDTVVRDRRRGASTVTMQLARLLSRGDTTQVGGKLRQIAWAVAIEACHSKREILEAYLTLAPYGGNIEGIEAASWLWLGKPARQLTAHEVAVLVSLPQAPARARHFDDPAFVNSRRQVAAALMARHPELTPADVGDAQTVRPHAMRDAIGAVRRAPHLVAVLATELEPSASPQQATAVTTIALPAQQAVEQAVAAYLRGRADAGLDNAAVLVADARGEILAYLGSAGFFDAGIAGQNDGVMARRSPGSTLKPFIYALAVDAGVIHSDSLLVDEPTRYGAYNPENFDGQFAGPLSARDALVASRNVPAVALLRELPAPGLYGFLQAAGVRLDQTPEHYGMSLALGGAEVSLRDLVTLYVGLVRGGRFAPLTERAGVDGQAPAQLLSPEASALLLDMLKDAPRPRGHESTPFAVRKDAVAFKTGTSWGFRDAWAVGVQGDVVVGVWVGNFDGEPNPALVGRSAAAPLLFDVLAALEPVLPARLHAPRPPLDQVGLRRVQVCAISGALPAPWCKHTKGAWFIPGRSPIAACDTHRAIEIDGATGLRTCDAHPGPRHRIVAEVWPTSTQHAFAVAGLPRAPLPPWVPACAEQARAPIGPQVAPPRITSPQPDVGYVAEPHSGVARVALTAAADGASRELTWFVDDRVAARGTVHLQHEIRLDAGAHVVRVVDDLGGTASTEVRVAYP